MNGSLGELFFKKSFFLASTCVYAGFLFQTFEALFIGDQKWETGNPILYKVNKRPSKFNYEENPVKATQKTTKILFQVSFKTTKRKKLSALLHYRKVVHLSSETGCLLILIRLIVRDICDFLEFTSFRFYKIKLTKHIISTDHYLISWHFSTCLGRQSHSPANRTN